MKKLKTLAVLAILAVATVFPTKSDALPIPLYGPGVCGYFEIVAYGGMIPGIIWHSVPCPVQQ